MEDELMSVTELASRLGKRKQILFRIKDSVSKQRSWPNANNHAQLVAFVANHGARFIQLELATADAGPGEGSDAL